MFCLLYIAIHILTSELLMTSTYQGLIIEPFSIIIGKPSGVPESADWLIGIYIIFGKHKFKLLYNPPGNTDSVCGASECVRGFGICIQIGKNANQVLKSFHERNPTNLGDLNVDDQNHFLGAFRDIINEGNPSNVSFHYNLDVIRNAQLPPGTTVFQTGLYLNGLDTTNWFFLVDNMNLVLLREEGVLDVLNGNPHEGNISIYKVQTNEPNIKSIVPFNNCEFNRKLSRIAICSKVLYNKDMCLYYGMLVALNPMCGGDVKPGFFKFRVVSPLVRFMKLLKKLLDILINNP